MVTTEPGSAQVLWDGQPVEGVTPMTLEDLPTGRHLLTIKKAGFEDVSKTVEIVATKTPSREHFELKALRGVVLIETVPPDAEVKIQASGKDLGTTPLLLADFPFGSTVLTLRKDGFDPKTIEIIVDSRVPQLITVDLKTRLASLNIRSVPEGAQVFLDGQFLNVTPFIHPGILEGTYKLSVQKQGYEPVEETIQIMPRTEFVKNVTLKQSPSRLEVESEPPNAEVYLDGRLMGRTPLKLPNLSSGEHSLKLILRRYSDYEKVVSLEAGKELSVLARMEKNTGSVQITTKPPEAQVMIDGDPKPYVTKVDKQGADVSEALTVQDVPVGERTITVLKNKFHAHEQKVTVAKDQITVLDVVLEQLDDTELILKPNIRWTGVIVNRFPDGSFEFRRRAGQGWITTIIKPEDVIEVRSIRPPSR